MTLSTVSVVEQIPQEIKHRDAISRSTSKHSSRAQEGNPPDVLVMVKVESEHSWKQVKLFIVELRVQNSQFRQWLWNILDDLASY